MGAELRVLGSVELIVDGVPLALGGSRQRAIIAFLALQGGRPASIPHLVDQVWGEDAPRTVVKSLSTLVSRLRHAVGPQGIQIEHAASGYFLEVPAGALDVARFRDAVARSRAAELTDDVDGAVDHLRAGLALWRGDALRGLDAPFVLRSRQTLLLEREAAEDSLAHLLRHKRALAESIELLQGLVVQTPYREDRWAMLMRSLTEAGRRVDAIGAFQEVRRRLRDDLGLEPGDALRAAEREALKAPPVYAPPPAPPEQLDLVGREAELEQVEATVRASVLHGMRALVITGEPGAGKSHLVQALVQRLSGRGIPVLVGRCDPLGAVPLGPLLDVIEQAVELGFLTDLNPDDFPAVIAALEGLGTTDPLIDSGDLRRRKLLRELGVITEGFARGRPLIVALEDFHWADPLTLAALHHLAVNHNDAPALLIATAREPQLTESPAGPILVEVSRSVPVERMVLGPLSLHDVGTMVADQLGSGVLDAEQLAQVALDAGGNPLYAMHLARHIADGLDPADVPLLTLELLQTRLRSLPERAFELVVAGAVLGLEFTIDEVSTGFADDPVALQHRVADARRAGLIEPMGEDGRIRFVHGLIRRAAYEMADRQRRTTLHLNAARLRGYGNGPATLEVAEHLMRARGLVPDDDVATAVIEAAGHAMGLGAHETAADLLESALRLDPEPGSSAALRILLGEALLAGGQGVDGVRWLTGGRDLARSIERWDLVAEALLAWERLGLLPTTEEARAQATRVTEVLDHGVADPRRRALLLCSRADLVVNVDPVLARASIEEAERVAASIASVRVARRVAYLRLREGEAAGADPGQMIEHAAALVTTSVAADDLVNAAYAATQLQAARVRFGDFRGLLGDFDRLRAIADAAGRAELGIQLDAAAVSAVMALEPLGVGEQASEALASKAMAGGMASAMLVRFLHVWVARREQLRLHEIEPMVAVATSSTKRVGLEPWLAACRVEAGDDAGARQLIEGVAARLLELPHDWARTAQLTLLAELAHDVAAPDDAVVLYGALLRSSGQVAALSGSVQVVGRVDRSLGRLAHQLDDHAMAIDHLGEARRLDRDAGAGLWAAWAARDEALVRLSRSAPGDYSAAVELLDGAAKTAKRYGSRRLARSVRALGGR